MLSRRSSDRAQVLSSTVICEINIPNLTDRLAGNPSAPQSFILQTFIANPSACRDWTPHSLSLFPRQKLEEPDLRIQNDVAFLH